MTKITNFNELQIALKNNDKNLEITRSFLLDFPIILSENTLLQGIAQEDGTLPTLMFSNSDGIGLTKQNNISDLIISVADINRAIFNASLETNLGEFTFKNLILKGQFSFITKAPNKTVKINLENIHVVSADTRRFLEQPQKYGVNVLQGALTIYNFNSDPDSLIKVNGQDIKIGHKNQPVIGSGIFIAGFGDNGGRTEISKLHTKEVYSTGKIPFGVADFITGGVFIVNGAHAKNIIHDGEVVTYGVNDMVLDAWGNVDNWQVNGPVISYGPSGVGFVNFGIVKNFEANDAIKTFGLGARGYNQYDGTLENGVFQEIETFGDGSVAIQVSKQVGSIEIKKDVKTHGGVGNSLVKGVNMNLPAYALSVKTGGSIDKLAVGGNIETYGSDVTSYIVENDANVSKINLKGVIVANGENSKALDIKEGGESPMNFKVEEKK
jgi:hypothetical protein